MSEEPRIARVLPEVMQSLENTNGTERLVAELREGAQIRDLCWRLVHMFRWMRRTARMPDGPLIDRYLEEARGLGLIEAEEEAGACS